MIEVTDINQPCSYVSLFRIKGPIKVLASILTNKISWYASSKNHLKNEKEMSKCWWAVHPKVQEGYEKALSPMYKGLEEWKRREQEEYVFVRKE